MGSYGAQPSHSLCLWRSLLVGPASNMAAQSDLEFTWGPWPRKARFARNLDLQILPKEEPQIFNVCFLTHVGMRWATHNLLHSMTEAERLYRELSKSEKDFHDVDVILLQYHRSYKQSLFGKLLPFVLGTNSVSWWDNGNLSNVWCCSTAKFPSEKSTHTKTFCSFKEHVQGNLGLEQTPVRSYTNVLIVNRLKSRKIVNIAEIERMFHTAGHQVTVAHLESFSFLQQVSLINNHSIVVAAHGAAWAWIALCTRPKSILMELMHVSYTDCPGLRSHRAHPWAKWTKDQKYIALLSVPHTTVGPRCRKQNGEGDIIANLSDLANHVHKHVNEYVYTISG